MKIDRITKAQLLLAAVSWLALLQAAITHVYTISMILMFVSFVGYKILCDYEAELKRRKYLARKRQRA